MITGLLFVRNGPNIPQDPVARSAFPLSRLGRVRSAAGGRRPQMASGGQWIRCGAGGHRFGRGARRRGRGAVTRAGVRQRAAGGVGCRVRSRAGGGGLAALCRGDPLPGVVGHGVADHVDDVERCSAAVVAAMGDGAWVGGVPAGRHGISGDRFVCLGCHCHPGGTARGDAGFGGGAGCCCPERRGPSVATDYRDAQRRRLQCVADADAGV